MKGALSMAKKDQKTAALGVQRDDALFETLGKNKKKKTCHSEK
jgi:hypothetical protein